ncbi:MAG: hypothetical protein ACQESK_10580 [Bacteroidota bacterium]
MKFIKRLGYYLSGFAIGLVILFFFLAGKKTSCDYGLDARVKKNIRIKDRVIAEKAQQDFKKLQIDTASISAILSNGSVNFNKSDTSSDSCKTYFISGKYQEKKLDMIFENCDSTATINRVFKTGK